MCWGESCVHLNSDTSVLNSFIVGFITWNCCYDSLPVLVHNIQMCLCMQAMIQIVIVVCMSWCLFIFCSLACYHISIKCEGKSWLLQCLCYLFAPPHTCTHTYTHSFLLAREMVSKKPVGFVNFRFDLDDNVEVVYW